MKYAFDCENVIDRHEWIRELIRSLIKSGHEVHCISAARSVNRGTDSAYVVLNSAIRKANVPLHGVYIAWYDEADGGPGPQKVAVMRLLGCEILFDDLPKVCEAVRAAGLIAVHVHS